MTSDLLSDLEHLGDLLLRLSDPITLDQIRDHPVISLDKASTDLRPGRDVEPASDEIGLVVPHPSTGDRVRQGGTASASTSDNGRRRSPWLLAGVAALVVVLVAALAVYRPNQPSTVGSGEDKTSGPSSLPQLPSQPTSGALLGSSLDTRIAPLVLVDDGGWTISYLNGTEDLSRGEMWVNRLVLVGDGPLYDSPWFSAAARPAGDYDLSTMGSVVDVGGIEGRIDVQQTDPVTGLDGPVITLVWPISNDRIAYVATVRMTQEEVLAISEALNFDPISPTVVVPSGFKRLDSVVQDPWLLFEYQYTNGGQSLQLDGSNVGVFSLLSNMAMEVRTNRVINGVDVALRPPAESGHYHADWMIGGWSFYVDATGIASEDDFVALLSKLHLVDGTQFASQAAPLRPLLPGDHLDIIQQLERGISLPANTPTVEWTSSAVATTEPAFAFRFYMGLACGWRTTWLRASDNADSAAQQAAATGVDTVAAKAGQSPDLSADQYTQLAGWMRANDRDQVTNFGSNDCPTWSATIG